MLSLPYKEIRLVTAWWLHNFYVYILSKFSYSNAWSWNIAQETYGSDRNTSFLWEIMLSFTELTENTL